MNPQARLPEPGFVRLKKIIEMVPVARSTVWKWIGQGKFPKPVQLSPGVSAFRAADVNAYLLHGCWPPPEAGTLDEPIGERRPDHDADAGVGVGADIGSSATRGRKPARRQAGKNANGHSDGSRGDRPAARDRAAHRRYPGGA